MLRMLTVLLGAAVLLAALVWWMTRPDTLRGRVVDYESGAPVGHVAVTASRQGWSLLDFAFRTYTDEATTDADGRFFVALRGSGTVRLRVVSGMHHPLGGRFTPGRDVVVPLKAQPSDAPDARYPAWAGGNALVGTAADGRPFGWSFADDAASFDPDEADLFPVDGSAAHDRPLALRAHPNGGIACRPLAALELDGAIDDALLLYVDEAPEAGYGPAVSFEPGHAGATCFVRTRDGRRYAKVAVEAGAGTWQGGDSPGIGQIGVARQLAYVYGYFPGRTLPYTRAAVRPDIAAAARDLDEAPADPTARRTFRFEIRDADERVIDRAELALRPGDAEEAVGTPLTDWPAYRYEDVHLVLDERGLPVLGFRIVGRHVASNHGIFSRGSGGRPYEPGRDPVVGPYDGLIPNTRHGAGGTFSDYTEVYREVNRSFRVRLVPSP